MKSRMIRKRRSRMRGRLSHLDAPVATHVVVVAVAILFAIRLVVLLLIADEVVERVAIVRRDEVDARV